MTAPPTCRSGCENASTFTCHSEQIEEVWVDLKPTLQSLDLSGNRIVAIDAAALGALSMLTHLNLNRNYIGKLMTGVFSNQTRLVKLELAYNQLTLVEEGAFAGLVNLQYLDLGKSAVVEYPTRVFQPLVSLTLLDLSFNANLLSLTPTLFLTNTNLDIVIVEALPRVVSDLLSYNWSAVWPNIRRLYVGLFHNCLELS